MIIQHNMPAQNAYRNLNINQSNLSKNLEKLSSGYRINRAGDDAAGLAISESMRAQIAGTDQAARNTQDAISLVQTAEGALTEVHSMLNRMATLATEAANGTYTTTARDNIQAEIDQLFEEIDRIAKTTEFNGVKPLLSNESEEGLENITNIKTKMTFQIGAQGTDDNILKVTISQMTTKTLFSSIEGNKISVSDTKKAAEAIKALNTAIDKVSTYRAQLGAVQNRLEHSYNNLKVTSENLQSAESRIRDTDMAEEMTQYTKNSILLQSAQSMLAQANSSPQGILSLLR